MADHGNRPLAGAALALATPAGMEDGPRRTAVVRGPDGLLVLAVHPPERALSAGRARSLGRAEP